VAQRLLRRGCAGCGGAGCAACHGSGYAGRTVTYEIMEVGRELATMISAGATEAELHARALAQGLVPMAAHAGRLAAAGTTTTSEVRRVLEPGWQVDDGLGR
jgi:general secretion pathway protein E